MEKTVSSKKIELYEPPAQFLLPCIAPKILLLENGDALSVNYQRYKTSSETCFALHQSLINWFVEARKAVAQGKQPPMPPVVK